MKNEDQNPSQASNALTRRNFMKKSALTVGAITLLSQGIALAEKKSGYSEDQDTCKHDGDKQDDGGPFRAGANYYVHLKCAKCGKRTGRRDSSKEEDYAFEAAEKAAKKAADALKKLQGN
jgi:hypothetical protein